MQKSVVRHEQFDNISDNDTKQNGVCSAITRTIMAPKSMRRIVQCL